MSINKGDVLTIPAYNQEAENAAVDLQWSQSLRTRSARYYIVKARNQSKGNAEVLLYVQDSYYKDFNNKVSGARQEGDSWVVTIDNQFQYGQKNKNGDGRWLALHDKNNKMYQHRFMVVTIQGHAAEWAKSLANTVGAGEIANQVMKVGNNFIGDYLHNF